MSKIKIKYKQGTHQFATIADDEFHEVCDEYENMETGVDGAELYRRFIGKFEVKWPETAELDEIKKLARTALEKEFEKAGIKKADPEPKEALE